MGLSDYTNLDNQKIEVLNRLASAHFSRVIDVGGVLHPWAYQYVTHYADLLELEYIKDNDPSLWTKVEPYICRSGYFNVDIGNPRTWNPVLKDVEKNGKFDFSLCCHVLEHIPEPSFAIEFLTTISKRGFVSVPSKYIELEWGNQFGEEGFARCGVRGRWRGAHCHRWIISLRDDCGRPFIWFWPKFNFVDHLEGLDEWVLPKLANVGQDRPGDLSFFWDEDIPFQIVTDDFLLDDVNPENACDLYRIELRKGL